MGKFWIASMIVGDLEVPQNGTFKAGRNAAKRAAREAEKAQRKARKAQKRRLKMSPPEGA